MTFGQACQPWLEAPALPATEPLPEAFVRDDPCKESERGLQRRIRRSSWKGRMIDGRTETIFRSLPSTSGSAELRTASSRTATCVPLTQDPSICRRPREPVRRSAARPPSCHPSVDGCARPPGMPTAPVCSRSNDRTLKSEAPQHLRERSPAGTRHRVRDVYGGTTGWTGPCRAGQRARAASPLQSAARAHASCSQSPKDATCSGEGVVTLG